jgi:hypothetical protein
MAECGSKHTKFQPDVDYWFCPKCGADNKNGDFYIEEDYGNDQ